LYALATATLISLLVFFVSELLLENMVIITDNVTTTLESWQMFVLIGDYSPAFKIHFYAISVVLIITLVNCFYGFAKIIVTKDKRRLKALIFQALLTVLFLGLCIFFGNRFIFGGKEENTGGIASVDCGIGCYNCYVYR